MKVYVITIRGNFYKLFFDEKRAEQEFEECEKRFKVVGGCEIGIVYIPDILISNSKVRHS